MLNVSLSLLLDRGVRLESGEAVAIAQLLVGGPGVPTIDNVELRSDGSAACIATGGTAGVKDVASFLQQLLPADVRVPAALRYTIARGLGVVEAPPFASLTDFSTSLRRFEARERGTIVRALLARASRIAPAVVPAELLEKPLEAAVLRPLVIPPVASAVPPPVTAPPPVAAVSPAPVAAPIPPAVLAPTPVVASIEADTEPAAELPLGPLIDVRPPATSVARSRGWRAAAVAAGLFASALGGYTVTSWRQGGDATSAATLGAVTPPVVTTPAVTTPANGSAGAPISREPAMAAATGGRVEPRNTAPAAASSPESTAAAPAPRDSKTAPSVPAAVNATAPLTTAPANERTATRQPPSASAASPAPAPGRDSKAPLQPYRALPAEELPALSPSFASNGTAMFFQTGGPGAAESAIAMASGGGWPGADLRIVKVVDDGSRNYHAQPSPDGRFIAFDSDREGVRAVYVANRDGSNVRRVSEPGYAAVPTWSPDGAQLAYIRAEAGKPSVWNLWVQPIAGGPARRVTNFRMGQTWGGSWFPDNRRIAYSHEDSLSIVDLATGQTREFASPVRGRLVRTPAVSPDGTRVVFQVYRSGAWMIDLRDGSMQCVLADPTAEEFAWAPDGRRIAYHSKRDGEWGIYVMPRG